ncbi:hypothetical protein [Sediminibacillus halophilus]|uniref:Uncharacterized protein n=1 Tax=Sediminibacillus halophilus TaxID=482461 RepID=A0A1G9V025_9BACI|nr:hypothetical protein [Sediminibacillus halophilus]SDM65488.1 hypothetical protein SAMN05216244_3070 [Sediminibacillus halophilus]
MSFFIDLGLILFILVILSCLIFILKQLKGLKDNQEYLIELHQKMKKILQHKEKNHFD